MIITIYIKQTPLVRSLFPRHTPHPPPVGCKSDARFNVCDRLPTGREVGTAAFILENHHDQ